MRRNTRRGETLTDVVEDDWVLVDEPVVVEALGRVVGDETVDHALL